MCMSIVDWIRSKIRWFIVKYKRPYSPPKYMGIDWTYKSKIVNTGELFDLEYCGQPISQMGVFIDEVDTTENNI